MMRKARFTMVHSDYAMELAEFKSELEMSPKTDDRILAKRFETQYSHQYEDVLLTHYLAKCLNLNKFQFL